MFASVLSGKKEEEEGDPTTSMDEEENEFAEAEEPAVSELDAAFNDFTIQLNHVHV